MLRLLPPLALLGSASARCWVEGRCAAARRKAGRRCQERLVCRAVGRRGEAAHPAVQHCALCARQAQHSSLRCAAPLVPPCPQAARQH